jgi:hypothetical protein
LTRARVTQLLALLRLHPDILAYVKSLPAGTPTKLVTERRLRVLARAPAERQVERARRAVAGFAGFCDHLSASPASGLSGTGLNAQSVNPFPIAPCYARSLSLRLGRRCSSLLGFEACSASSISKAFLAFASNFGCGLLALAGCILRRF